MYDLGVPAGFVSGGASGINASGQVVGSVIDGSGQSRAFRWIPDVPNGTTGTMFTLPQGTAGAAQDANAINAAGAVAGESWFRLRPTVWGSAGGYQLPLLDYTQYGYGYGINDRGYVVGQNSYDYWYFDYWDEWNQAVWSYYTISAAFLWDSVNGTRDLGAM